MIRKLTVRRRWLRWVVGLMLFALSLTVVTAPAVANRPWALKPTDLQVYNQPQTVPAARVEQRQEQLDRIVPERFDLRRYPVTDANETHWRQTLWATAVLEPQRADIAEAVAAILTLTQRPQLSVSRAKTVHMAMQIGTQLYLSNPGLYSAIGDRFQETLHHSPHAKWAAMSLSALLQQGLEPQVAQGEVARLRDRFAGQETLVLNIALRDLQEQLTPASLPPLTDLLNWQVAPQQAQIYVFCRPNRDVLCLGLIKDQDGDWLQEEDGSLWQVPLLARSLHGLRWNYIRGATPQGIYRIEGTMPRSTTTYFRAFGQFPLVKMFMPFERGVKTFVPPQNGTLNGAVSVYQSLLPLSWRGYFPMEEAYWAGRRGRGLIRIHGSGEPPEFFGNNERAPESYAWNPAIGCISAIETYDDSGRLQRADMPKILQSLSDAAGGQVEGYVVMVDVPGSNVPMTSEDLGLS